MALQKLSTTARVDGKRELGLDMVQPASTSLILQRLSRFIPRETNVCVHVCGHDVQQMDINEIKL